jgi:hypothetical protein
MNRFGSLLLASVAYSQANDYYPTVVYDNTKPKEFDARTNSCSDAQK